MAPLLRPTRVEPVGHVPGAAWRPAASLATGRCPPLRRYRPTRIHRDQVGPECRGRGDSPRWRGVASPLSWTLGLRLDRTLRRRRRLGLHGLLVRADLAQTLGVGDV